MGSLYNAPDIVWFGKSLSKITVSPILESEIKISPSFKSKSVKTCGRIGIPDFFVKIGEKDSCCSAFARIKYLGDLGNSL